MGGDALVGTGHHANYVGVDIGGVERCSSACLEKRQEGIGHPNDVRVASCGLVRRLATQ